MTPDVAAKDTLNFAVELSLPPEQGSQRLEITEVDGHDFNELCRQIRATGKFIDVKDDSWIRTVPDGVAIINSEASDCLQLLAINAAGEHTDYSVGHFSHDILLATLDEVFREKLKAIDSLAPRRISLDTGMAVERCTDMFNRFIINAAGNPDFSLHLFGQTLDDLRIAHGTTQTERARFISLLIQWGLPAGSIVDHRPNQLCLSDNFVLTADRQIIRYLES